MLRFFMDNACGSVPEGLCSLWYLLPLPLSPLEHAPEGNMVSRPPFPATCFSNLQTQYQYLSPYYVPGTMANMLGVRPHLLLTIAQGPIIPTL